MEKTSKPRFHPVFGVLTGFASIVALAMLWHLFGFAPPPDQESYPYTQYFTGNIAWAFVGLYALISLALGWATQRAWHVATGMILPLPFAFLIEVFQDPTSHNLIPFEIILFWLPAFAIAACGAYGGQLLRTRAVRGIT